MHNNILCFILDNDENDTLYIFRMPEGSDYGGKIYGCDPLRVYRDVMLSVDDMRIKWKELVVDKGYTRFDPINYDEYREDYLEARTLCNEPDDPSVIGVLHNQYENMFAVSLLSKHNHLK